MKVVLTVAGLGTRLLPLTKEIPKEMLPIYAKTKGNTLIFKPILQVIFESLYNFRIRKFCFIVGKTKRAVKEHFVPNDLLIKTLQKEEKVKLIKIMKDFFAKLKKSQIIFITQPKPIGFGNAIQYAKKFVGKDIFLLHAGDDIVISKNNNHLKRLIGNYKKFNSDYAFLIERVQDPKKYGVVNGKFINPNVIDVKEIEEKPKKPKTNLAIIAIYVFKPKIFYYLERVSKTSTPQNQLTDAIRLAIKNNEKVIGIILNNNEYRVDIGTPETYFQTLISLKEHSKKI